MYLNLLALLLLVPLAEMVKEHDFKKCQQSGFCSRQRFWSHLSDSNKLPFGVRLDPPSIHLEKDSLNAKILSPESVYTLSIIPLVSSCRITIKPLEPIQPIYDKVADFTFESNPKSMGWTWKVLNESLTLSWGKSSLILYLNPFKIELYNQETLVTTFNERNYFYYEYPRKKSNKEPSLVDQTKESVADSDVSLEGNANEKNQESVHKEDDSSKEKEKEKETQNELTKDLWEESFSGKVDSKPRGPGSIGIDINFPDSNHVYGLPEHASDFSLKTTRFTLLF